MSYTFWNSQVCYCRILYSSHINIYVYNIENSDAKITMLLLLEVIIKNPRAPHTLIKLTVFLYCVYCKIKVEATTTTTK